jgi:hypothetical protein
MYKALYSALLFFIAKAGKVIYAKTTDFVDLTND